MKWIYYESASDIFTDNLPPASDILDNKSLVSKTLFDPNTQEKTKAQVYPSDVSSFPPLHEKKSRQEL